MENKLTFFLSAEELVKRKYCDRSLPRRNPKDSPVAVASLPTIYGEQRLLLAEERAEKLGSLSRGQYVASRNAVELGSTRGKFWHTMGYTDNGKRMLHPEEALFLLETSQLEVYHGKVPMSVQEAYASLLSGSCSVDQYHAYAHLSRLGYIAVRHRSSSPKRDKNLADDSKRPKLEKNGSQTDGVLVVTLDEPSSPKKKMLHSPLVVIDITDSPENKKARLDDDVIVIDDVPSDDRGVKQSSPPRAEVDAAVPLADADLVEFPLPNMAGQDVLHLPIPPAHLLPPNVTITEDMCTVDLSKLFLDTSQSTMHRKPRSSDSDWRRKDPRKGENNFRKTDCYKDYRYSAARHEHRDRVARKQWNNFQRRGTHDNWRQSDSSSSSSCERVSEFRPWPHEGQEHMSRDSWGSNDSRSYSPHRRNGGSSARFSNSRMNYQQQQQQQPPPPQNNWYPQTNFSFAGSNSGDDSSSWSRRRSAWESRDVAATAGPAANVGREAHNWKEYKRAVQCVDEKVHLQRSPAGHLWQGSSDAAPLVQPKDATSTAALLEKLRTIKNISVTEWDRTALSNTTASKLKISYDVYLPRSGFRKSNRGLPNHRIIVASCRDPFPDLADVAAHLSALADGVPLHFAVVDCGQVQFYSLNDVSLPAEIGVG